MNHLRINQALEVGEVINSSVADDASDAGRNTIRPLRPHALPVSGPPSTFKAL